MYIVPIEAGIRYMQAPMPIEVITNQGKKDTTPFGCESIEAQSGDTIINVHSDIHFEY